MTQGYVQKDFHLDKISDATKLKILFILCHVMEHVGIINL